MKTIIAEGISNLLPGIFKKTNQVRKQQEDELKKVNFPEIKNPHDFVQIPGTKYIISKYEINGIEKGSFRGGIKQMNAKRISMATPYLFLLHLYNLVNCQNNQVPVFDAIGNVFSSLEVNDMFCAIKNNPKPSVAYQGGTWLGPEYCSFDIKSPLTLDSLNNRLFKKSISDGKSIEESVFVKDGLINYGPFSLPEGKILGGTGEGDGFMFYSIGDELYLDFKCNPIIINETPRIYGVLEQDSFITDTLTESGSIIRSFAI